MGDLKGAVHDVPAVFEAPALNVQENEGTSLTVGTSAVVTHTPGEPIVNEHTVTVPALGHYIGKREAEADPYLLYGHGYGLGLGTQDTGSDTDMGSDMDMDMDWDTQPTWDKL